jgi:very-short-patch-repair endonuclease
MRSYNNQERTEESVDERIARIAARQHGLITRKQVVGAGASSGTIRWRVRAGRWHRIASLPGAYRIAGTPVTWRQRAIAGCLYLGAQATLSFRAAAALQGFVGFRPSKVEVTVGKNRHRDSGRRIIIHIPTAPIPMEDIEVVDGIPVTKPARTLLDLATVEPEDVIERSLDDALRRRLISIPFLQKWLSDPSRRRHRGARVLQRLVDARAARGATESPLETKLLQLMHDRGLPLPMLQYVLREKGRDIARLDFAYPVQRVAIEADGFRHHDTRATFDQERARRNAVETAGWRVLQITSAHIERDPDSVIEWITRALEL